MTHWYFHSNFKNTHQFTHPKYTPLANKNNPPVNISSMSLHLTSSLQFPQPPQEQRCMTSQSRIQVKQVSMRKRKNTHTVLQIPSLQQVNKLQVTERSQLSKLQGDPTYFKDQVQTAKTPDPQVNHRCYSPSSVPIQSNESSIQLLVLKQKDQSINPNYLQDQQVQQGKQQLQSNPLELEQFQETYNQDYQEFVNQNLNQENHFTKQTNNQKLCEAQTQIHATPQIIKQKLFFSNSQVMQAIQEKIENNKNQTSLSQQSPLKFKNVQNISQYKKSQKKEEKLNKQNSLKVDVSQNLDFKISCGGGFTSNNRLHDNSQPKCYANAIVKGRLQSLFQQYYPLDLEPPLKNELDQEQEANKASKIKKGKSKSKVIKQSKEKENNQFLRFKDRKKIHQKRNLFSCQNLSRSSKQPAQQIQRLQLFKPQVQGNFVLFYKKQRTAVEDYFSFIPVERIETDEENLDFQSPSIVVNQLHSEKYQNTQKSQIAKDQKSLSRGKINQSLQKEINFDQLQEKSNSDSIYNNDQLIQDKNKEKIQLIQAINDQEKKIYPTSQLLMQIQEETQDKVSTSYELSALKSKYQTEKSTNNQKKWKKK